MTNDGRYYIAGTEKNSTLGLVMKYHIAYNPINNASIRFLSVDKKNFGCDGSCNLDISKYIENTNFKP